MTGLTAFPSGVNARVPCYGFNEGDWFIWNAMATNGSNNPPNTRGVFGPNLSRRIAAFTDGTSNTLIATDVKALNPFCQVGGQFSEPNLSSPTAPPPRPTPTRSRSHPNTRPSQPAMTARPAKGTPPGSRQFARDRDDHRLVAPRPASRSRHPDLADQQESAALRGDHGPKLPSRGVNAVFADGSVHFIKSTVDGNTWRALGTIAGGEVISSDSY